MQEYAPAQENRAEEVSAEVITELAKIGAPQSDTDVSEHLQIYQALPRQMTRDEVDRLGLRVSNFVEQIVPSRDGFSRGRRSEVNAIHWVGSVSLLRGDSTTFESAKQHLKAMGLHGKIASIALWYEERRN